jgi:hypothetical protein
MTKLIVPHTHVAAGSSTGFLKYFAISAVLGFMAVAFALLAWRIAT